MDSFWVIMPVPESPMVSVEPVLSMKKLSTLRLPFMLRLHSRNRILFRGAVNLPSVNEVCELVVHGETCLVFYDGVPKRHKFWFLLIRNGRCGASTPRVLIWMLF